MQSILIMYHCESNTGYAIGKLEPIFFKMALALCDNDSSRVHISYPSMEKGPSPELPSDFDQYLIIDPATNNHEDRERMEQYILRHSIDTLFAFDQPVSRPVYKCLRRAGIKYFVSYWGAPMSSIFGWFKRMLKRIDVLLHPNGPDLYIFESQGMADTAVLGRGIPRKKVEFVYLSVDTDKFSPNPNDQEYIYEKLGIPMDRKIFFYSGHMEERKGVHVLISAVRALVEDHSRHDFHLVLLGNKNGEESRFQTLLEGRHADHVTFGGYRNDIAKLHRGCFAGMIGSTGWDSLTCSALEMASSGLPLLVSDLPGLKETVVHGETGYLFPSGSAEALSKKMLKLLQNPEHASTLGKAARQRALRNFSQKLQHDRLVGVVRQTISTR